MEEKKLTPKEAASCLHTFFRDYKEFNAGELGRFFFKYLVLNTKNKEIKEFITNSTDKGYSVELIENIIKNTRFEVTPKVIETYFLWRNTEEGKDFWFKVSTEWKKYYKKILENPSIIYITCDIEEVL